MSGRPFDRALLGILAGVAATMAMTATMRRLHAILPDDERYPLPPRELVDNSVVAADEDGLRSKTLLAHFGFGGFTGALFALLPAIRGDGVVYGLGVWALSYFGWIPAARILAPAHRHAFRRNSLMIAAHIVWGLTLSKSLKEMESAADEAFASSGKRPMRPKEKAERRRG
ncbi:MULTISPECIES: hypothetical protein [unclassified Mesorhizobium]|uniref:hypothetical protein n=1 Tax=unclassified Mesorhizobium TaxID=325217 RepID=UPI002417BAB6|nr:MULTISPECIES: hypothetical protein [unclassified Mesorhizobium]WFP65713.1 hypothetical protein QAZ47_14790 [Mesorhizobium sp. WSM4904]WFP78975.1 hypothetical protein QAZ22_14725 [Mesorhizobium sp. WSM4906]